MQSEDSEIGVADSVNPGMESNLDVMINFITRPSRANYHMENLGPCDFKCKTMLVHRTDFTLTNPRGYDIVCSLYEPQPEKPTNPPISMIPKRCIVYCHGNESCRLEVETIQNFVLPYGCATCAFDFSGSGMSGGEYVSLGFYEKDDLSTVVDYLRNEKHFELILLWGRSMGAATCIMYAGSRLALDTKGNQKIMGMVLDSPYESFSALADNFIAQAFPSTVSRRLLLTAGLIYLKKQIKKKADFDIDAIKPIISAKSCSVPVLFFHGTEDKVCPYRHAENLIKNYQCSDKQLVTLEGADHADLRPYSAMETAFFFAQRLFFGLDIVNFATIAKQFCNDTLMRGRYESAISSYTILLSKLSKYIPLPDDIIQHGSSSDILSETKKPEKSNKILGLMKQPGLMSHNSLKRFWKRPNKRLSSDEVEWKDSDRDAEMLQDFALAIYGNRSLSYAKLGKGELALADANSGLILKPDWVRGFQRKATALMILENPEAAKESVKKGLEYEPQNDALIKLLQDLEK